MKGPRFLRQSLAARLALVLGLISVLAVVTMGLAIYFLTARYLEDRAQDDLAALADFYAAYSAATAADEVRLAAMAPQITSFFAPQAGYEVRLFGTSNGTLLAATHDIGPLPSRAALAELVRRRPALFLTPSYDRPGQLYTARPVLAADGSVMAVVEVSRDIGEVRSFLATLRLALVAAGGLALLAALLASLLLARQITRPLHQMESATQTIASGDFSQRLAVASEDEIGRLATSINQMADDLARLEGERREFIAKISHDLRTPLTAIKGTVVNLQDRAPDELQPPLALMDEQADRLTRLVNDLLALSRLQRGELRLRCAATDLAAVARSSAAIASEKAQRLGVTLRLDLPEALPPVWGDADRLQQVVVNLLDNALRATSAGGTVQVQLAATGQEVTLTVTDDGRGLSAEEEAHAFEPHFRGPDGGAGLGLAIAREIVTAHGGRIWLKPRPQGGAEAGFVVPVG
jgi:signal transduction histidine kinase